jgi:hypothetical protein
MMPFRITSPNPHDRQIAILNLALLKAMATDTDLYVGICGCETTLENGILIIAARSREKCLFCNRTVELTRVYKPDGVARKVYHADRTATA